MRYTKPTDGIFDSNSVKTNLLPWLYVNLKTEFYVEAALETEYKIMLFAAGQSAELKNTAKWSCYPFHAGKGRPQ